MKVEMTLTLDVGEQDSTEDAIDSAQNQLRHMEREEIVGLLDYEVAD